MKTDRQTERLTPCCVLCHAWDTPPTQRMNEWIREWMCIYGMNDSKYDRGRKRRRRSALPRHPTHSRSCAFKSLGQSAGARQLPRWGKVFPTREIFPAGFRKVEHHLDSTTGFCVCCCAPLWMCVYIYTHTNYEHINRGMLKRSTLNHHCIPQPPSLFPVVPCSQPLPRTRVGIG